MLVYILKITLHRIVLEQKGRNADFGRSGLYMGASLPVAHREYPSSDLRAPPRSSKPLQSLAPQGRQPVGAAPTHAFSLFLLEACGFTVSHCEASLF